MLGIGMPHGVPMARSSAFLTVGLSGWELAILLGDDIVDSMDHLPTRRVKGEGFV